MMRSLRQTAPPLPKRIYPNDSGGYKLRIGRRYLVFVLSLLLVGVSVSAQKVVEASRGELALRYNSGYVPGDEYPDPNLGFFEVTNGTISPEKPYFEFSYAIKSTGGRTGRDASAIRKVIFSIKTSNGYTYTVAETARACDKMVVHTSYGVCEIVNPAYKNSTHLEPTTGKTVTRYDALARFYPNTSLLKGSEYITSFSVEALWDWSDNGGKISGEGSIVPANSAYGDWWYRCTSPVKINFSRPKGEFKRSNPGKLTFSASGISTAGNSSTRRNVYDFKSTSTSSADYGTVILESNANTVNYELNKTFSNKNSFTVYTLGASAETESRAICNGSLQLLCNEKNWIMQRFETPVMSHSIPGCAYPEALTYASDMWKKSIALSWNTVTSGRNIDGKWYIYRTKSGGTRQLLGSVSYDTNSYEDTSAEYDVSYTYEVSFGLTGWSTDNPVSDLMTSRSNVTVARTLPMTLTTAISGGITVTWKHAAIADINKCSFAVMRQTNGTGTFTKIATITPASTSATSHSYTDATAQSYTSYTYKIVATILGKDIESPTIIAMSTAATTISSFSTSKGTYSGSVKISWDANLVGSLPTTYSVSRRLANSSNDFKEIYRTSGTASTYFYEDNLAVPGQYFEYQLVSSVESDGKLATTSNKSDIGFSQSTGTISGRIAYGTGTAVPNVKVNLVKSDENNTSPQFYSTRINGLGGGMRWNFPPEEGKKMFVGKPFTIQFWVKPDADIMQPDGKTYASPMLVEAYNAFALYLQKNEASSSSKDYIVYMHFAGETRPESLFGISSNSYSHLTITYDGNGRWEIAVIHSDGSNNTRACPSRPFSWSTSSSSTGISFGTSLNNADASTFKGNIDDVRVWSKYMPVLEVVKNPINNQILSGTEKDLMLYWPMDEGVKGYLFDISKTGGVANENHGVMSGDTYPSESIPTENQLSLYGKTDSNGNYTVRGIPFSGDGCTYSVVPTYGVHQFSPSKQSRFINSTSLNHSGVDMLDVSSFAVSGVVYYENTTYPVEGAELYVDGNICSKDGEVIKTDKEGKFTISVPIGDHFIQMKKQGHTFVDNGRYPADPNNTGERYTFTNPMKDLAFYDNTKVTIAGRVAGGNVQSELPLGLAQGKANIGRAAITLQTGYKMNVVKKTVGTTVTYENNTEPLAYNSPTSNVNSSTTVGGEGNDEYVRTITILTDSITGEFAAEVPPVQYEVQSVKIASNDEIIFDKGSFNKIDASNPVMIQTDSTEVDGKLEKFKYVASFSAIHYATPSFTVTDKGNKAGAFGESTYKYKDLNQEADLELYSVNEQGEVNYTYGYPIFVQLNKYNFKLKAFEKYINQDNKENPVVDIVPLAGTIVSITNQMSASQEVYVEDGTGVQAGEFHGELKENQLALDSIGEATYTFLAGFPNINGDYTRGLNISYSNNGKNLNWDQNDTFKAIVLGTLPSGSNFVTAGPDKVLMVLRDPPGTSSSASWEEGRSVAFTQKDGGSFVTNNDITTVTHLGADVTTITGTPGFGMITDAKSTVDLSVGLKMNLTVESSTSSTTTVTTSKKVSTMDQFDFVGAPGDVFIGCATNILFGNARSIGFDKNTDGAYEISLKDVITTGSKFGTAFNYSQNFIENTLIPNLIKSRNSMIRSLPQADYANITNTTEAPIFVSKLSKEDSRFGSKNTDEEIWNELANTGANKAKLEGPSYKMVLPEVCQKDVAYQDSVLWYNEQIELWVQTLANNEKAKVEAHEGRETWFDTNYSFDAGARIESSTSTAVSKEKTTTTTVETLAVLGAETGAQIAGVGVSLTATTETGGSYVNEGTDSEENTVTVSYTLAEDGDDDALTVDVFKAPDGFGPIFRTRGGQTSCPYEGQIVTKYYRPGTELSAATMQIEIPQISVVNAYANNVPSGKNAAFELKLSNSSETGEDVWFNLSLLDETNPNGAKLTMDGAVLTGGNGRAILVRAGETMSKALQLSQTDLGVLDYENIKIVLKSQCQGDPTGVNDVIADTVSINAHFVPSCSDVTLQIENRVMNTFTSSTLQMVVKDYDKAYKNFKGIRIQYKGERDVDWKLVQEYVMDEKDKTNNNEYLPDGKIDFKFDMGNTALYPDQTYQFRVITMCLFGNETVNNESETITVIKDMRIPMILGKPSPSDGILSGDNEVSLVFNEAIKSSSLSGPDNFSVTGVLNGYTIAHSVAMKLQNSSAAYTEANIDLSNRSFSMDMWLKYTAGGTIFAHGGSVNKFVAKIDATGKLAVSVNGQNYTSAETIPANKWVFLSISYDYAGSASTLSASYALDASSKTLFNGLNVAGYGGNGRLAIGEKMTGAIHELTLWNKARSFVEAQSKMYVSKVPSTQNLIGYWKMDEGNGTTATDVARNRHLTIPNANSWYLENANKAAALDGTGYLALNTSTCPIEADEDYTVEMWFRGDTHTNNASLFSVNDTLINVRFVPAGGMEMIARGVKTPVTSQNYLDNNWHHFALNVQRNGNAIIYIDGEAVKQVAAVNVPALATDRIVLGADRYKDSQDGSFAYRDFFKGTLDDVRLWKAQLTADVIRANRYNCLTGKEAGLIAYYPFEKKGLDSGNQVVANPSLEDQSITAAGDAEGKSVIGDQAPGLKEARTLTNVNFSYVASDTKIVIDVTEEPNIIEGCTLYFTVRDVRDINNNLSNPVTWSAYVSANRLKWDEEVMSVKKEVSETSTFQVTISNRSGNAENWSLLNLPSWLSVNAESGTLKPLASKVLTFTVNSSTPIGKYEETVYLSGNNKIDEPLVVNLAVTGIAPDWSVNPADYEMSMNITGQLKIAGITSEDSDDLIAAFADGKCVGVASPVYYKRYDAYYVLMTVYGSKEWTNKNITFKAWDAGTGYTYPILTPTKEIIFKDGSVEGSFATPFIWNAKDMVEQEIGLAKGWNWNSIFVDNIESMSVSNMLNSIRPVTEIVKGQSSFTVPSTSSWEGDLKELAVGKMYKIKTNAATALKAVGRIVVPSGAPVMVQPNWNWIGYNVSYPMTANDAFAGLSPVNGDMVKSHGDGFSVYDGYEWVGSLAALVPGKGYLYQSKASTSKTFTYPGNTKKASAMSNAPAKAAAMAFTPVAENAYPNNMTMIATVVDENQTVVDAEVGVFANNECRGANKTNAKGLVFITIAGDGNGTPLTFKILANGKTQVVNQDLIYSDDAMYGTLEKPYVIKITSTGINSLDYGINVYPTLVKDFVNVTASGEELASISVLNIDGKTLYLNMEPTSENKVSFRNYDNGVYLIVVKTVQGEEKVYRVVK